MMEFLEIKRDEYLKKLVARMRDGMAKLVTGMRGCGKTHLLFRIFKEHLLAHGVPGDHVIEARLDLPQGQKLRDPQNFISYVKSRIKDQSCHFVLIDEVQMMEEFEPVLNYLLSLGILDVYASGSNSSRLTSGVATEFRGRGEEIRVHPLSFSEFMGAYDGSAAEGWFEYCAFGGLPRVLSIKDPFGKAEYLRQLFEDEILRGIRERCRIRDDGALHCVATALASSAGDLVNPLRLGRAIKGGTGRDISAYAIEKRLSCLEDAFIVSKAYRYDIKGRRRIGTPYKCYFEDTGLRNLGISMWKLDQTRLMENILHNELRLRGYRVEVGNIQKRAMNSDGSMGVRTLEVDFIASRGSRRIYVQSALSVQDADRMAEKKRPLMEIGDSFSKIIVTKDSTLPMYDEDGIIFVNLFDFLLNKEPSLL